MVAGGASVKSQGVSHMNLIAVSNDQEQT